MIRKIIKIDEDKCNGCELCTKACHEGAIGMIEGKAKLLRDDYCDGLGDCLPSCPTGAISFEKREAAPYDETAVKTHIAKLEKPLPCGCPSSNSHAIQKKSPALPAIPHDSESQLMQWPVQIKLIPVNAPYFNNASLLISADCAAYSYANFHNKFMKNRVTLIGCPKLDDGDYSEKLTQIIKNNDIKSVTVVRMVVPCCGGIENAVIRALQESKKMIPWQIVTISTDGKILEN